MDKNKHKKYEPLKERGGYPDLNGSTTKKKIMCLPFLENKGMGEDYQFCICHNTKVVIFEVKIE